MKKIEQGPKAQAFHQLDEWVEQAGTERADIERGGIEQPGLAVDHQHELFVDLVPEQFDRLLELVGLEEAQRLMAFLVVVELAVEEVHNYWSESRNVKQIFGIHSNITTLVRFLVGGGAMSLSGKSDGAL